MTTEKQILANRANALKSTGPRTEAGKRIASRNAVTHGLLAEKQVLIRQEDVEEFEAFRQCLTEDLAPVGQLELLLAERIIAFFWRLKRSGRMEQALMNLLYENPDDSQKGRSNQIPFKVVIHKSYEEPMDDPDYVEFLKYKQAKDQAPDPPKVNPADKPCEPSPFSNDLSIQLAAESKNRTTAPKEPEKTREDENEPLGRMVKNDFSGSQLLARLLRYEGQLERGLYKALTELQKLQFLRKRNEAIFTEARTAEVLPEDSMPFS